MKAIAQIIGKVKTLDVGPGARTLNNESAAAANAAAMRNVKGIVKLVEGSEVWVSLEPIMVLPKVTTSKSTSLSRRRIRKARSSPPLTRPSPRSSS